MDTLRWHTIKGNKVFLDSVKRRIINYHPLFEDDPSKDASNRYELLASIRDFEIKWFYKYGKTTTDGARAFGYILDIEQYEDKEFNTKQFYKEFIDCIIPHLSESDFRDLRITSILREDFYSREELEKYFYGNS